MLYERMCSFIYGAKVTEYPSFNMVTTHLENLEESVNLSLVREKLGKLWCACGVLLLLQ